MTGCCDHGVPWEHGAHTAKRGEDLDNNAKHNERWLQWRQFAQRVTGCVTFGQAGPRMHDERLFERRTLVLGGATES